jgi:hypothetical protein
MPVHICLSILTVTILLLVYYSDFINSNYASGQDQSSSSSKPQTWMDNLSNIKIEFTNVPASPVIDKPTKLNFEVVHLQNETKLENLSARVIILANAGEQQRTFIFPDIVSKDGRFSVNYLFPDSGTYQILSRINSKGFISLASFTLFVPVPGGNPTSPTDVSLIIFAASIAGIIGIMAVVALRYIQSKRIRGEGG